ncbi:hypothetical protein roselon_02437 [Roseibacterium elongatum DSM 19469]|uniref:Uncharacterized protein n=1 Tax=Roseicyclus elongatus DSM 19469 TaxID=1294273 RepID=W8S3H6_9RHOB|nr:hypothetical protein [Roseibacterium elongatum]AHM04762.1 hypothetical protein roselon_02437 [Roseibacterium elongatum DSM 19469]
MTSRIDKLRAQIRAAQSELFDEIEERRARFRYSFAGRRVQFEGEIRARHRAARENLVSFLSRARPLVLLTAPVIYALILPFVLLDLFVTVYQAVCFPVYGIPRVRRAEYIVIDRHQLQYLNALQKLNCIYCGYCNGLIGYVREIAARTEAYWCPIKHARRIADPHDQYTGFADFGDDSGFQAHVEAQRAALKGRVDQT